MAMNGYTKLFNSILLSTIWAEKNETRIVWITMLAAANSKGVVEASIPGLAYLARVSEQDCREAIAVLESPDTESRTSDNEGRRIQKVDGGWLLLNHSKYRDKLSADERREYNRVKQQRYRKRQQTLPNVTDSNEMSAPCTHTDSDTDSDSDTKEEKNTHKSIVSELGSPEFKAFFDAYPVKTGRKEALSEWCRQMLDSGASRVMASLTAWKACERWQNPKFIPYAAKWLNDQWRSQPVVPKKEGAINEQELERVRAMRR